MYYKNRDISTPCLSAICGVVFPYQQVLYGLSVSQPSLIGMLLL